MASSSSILFSGKSLKDSKDEAKMAFLDMSLDEIISLRMLDCKNNEKPRRRENSDSREQSSSYTPSHHQQRRYSKTRSSVEKSYRKKPYQESFGSKPGQSPLNRKPFNKQNFGSLEENYSHDYKIQAEKNRDQSNWSHYQPERYQGQSGKNHYHSERSQDYYQRSYGQPERSHGYRKRSHDRSERFQGQFKRYHGHQERSCDEPRRCYDHSERYYGYSERSYDHSKRSPVLAKPYHNLSERFQFLSERSRGESERFHNQSGKYQHRSPVGRSSFHVGSEFDRRTVVIKARNDSFEEPKQQKHYRENLKGSIILETSNDFYDNDERRSNRYKRRFAPAFLENKHTIPTKNALHKPKGIFLTFNFHAMDNQTKLSLDDRFSSLKMNKKPE